MAVITLTIEESENELVSGIPKSVTLTTNIPATIFYTFDGTTPTTSSSIYVDVLNLPTDQPTLVFNVFATNGTDSSSVITRTYRPNISILRQSHDTTPNISTDQSNANQKFPYGTIGTDLPVQFDSFGPSDSIVDKTDSENVFDGYDGTSTGTFSGGLDKELENYLIRFSESNAIGERGRGIGTLPAAVKIAQTGAPPRFSNMNDKYFDARALVIIQDSRENPFDPNILQINRQYFSSDDSNVEKVKDGVLKNTTGFEGLAPTGSFLRAHFNPRENTTTYYYHDSATLKWVISIEPARQSSSAQNLSRILYSPRNKGDRFVFRWVPFKGSRLI